MGIGQIHRCCGTRSFLSVWILPVAVLLVFTIGTDPVSAEPVLSQELKVTIMNRMAVPTEREKVLKSAAEAVENGYPEKSLELIIQKSLDSGINGEALSDMITILDKARGKGLPTQPYADKIMEGLAKGVKESRILLALKRVDRRMELAADLAGKVDGKGRSNEDLVVKTADAIAAGMNYEVLEKVYTTMAEDRVNRKIEPEEIMEMVKAASGYGVDSRTVGEYAVSLMKNRDSDPDDIRKYLEELSESAYSSGSGSGSEDEDGSSYGHGDDEDDDHSGAVKGGEDDAGNDGGDDVDEGGGEKESDDGDRDKE